MSNPILQDILSYLRSEYLETIRNVDITSVNKFIKDIKPIITEKYNIDEKTFKSYKEHLSSYTRALITLNFCLNNNKNLYDSLFNCSNNSDILSKLQGQLPEQYSLATNVRKNIIKEVKLLKKETSEPINIDSNLEETLISPKSEKGTLSASELNSLILSDKNLSKKLSILPDEEIYLLIKSTYGSNYNITDTLIDEYLTTFYSPSKIELEEKHNIDKIALINKEYSEEIIALKQEKSELEIENDTLKNKNELLDKTNIEKDKKILQYASEIKELKDKLNNKNRNTPLSLSFKDSPVLIDPTIECCDARIKKPLLDKAVKILQDNNLINLTELMVYQSDLRFAIVQLVFLCFINQNSFY